jgi:hypothetical protein
MEGCEYYHSGFERFTVAFKPIFNDVSALLIRI